MGNTSKNITKAFSYAIEHPCIFMLDEIDCISIKRSEVSSSSSEEFARVTITLMQEFDKLTNDIIVIGATNRMDDALLRRFSIKHEVSILNNKEKVFMVKKYLSDVNIEMLDTEINELVSKNENQAMLINELINRIAEKFLKGTD